MSVNDETARVLWAPERAVSTAIGAFIARGLAGRRATAVGTYADLHRWLVGGSAACLEPADWVSVPKSWA